MRTVIAALAMVLGAGVANAQENSLAKIGLSGLGASSCGWITANYRRKQSRQAKTMWAAIYLAWAHGFISGINRGNDALNGGTPNSVL